MMNYLLKCLLLLLLHLFNYYMLFYTDLSLITCKIKKISVSFEQILLKTQHTHSVVSVVILRAILVFERLFESARAHVFFVFSIIIVSGRCHHEELGDTNHQRELILDALHAEHVQRVVRGNTFHVSTRCVRMFQLSKPEAVV